MGQMQEPGVCFSAPARVDLAGGTLDVPPLCYLVPGATTVNLAVDMRARVLLRWGVHGHRVYQGDDWGPVARDSIFEKVLSFFDPPDSVDIEITGGIPVSSGLGGSSALLVALCAAFCALTDRRWDNRELLDMVTILEHRVLGKPAGTQDGIASLSGGLQAISFAGGRPEWRSLPLPGFLADGLPLVQCPIRHHSGLNNWSIIRRACEGEGRLLGVLREISDNARVMVGALEAQDEAGFLSALRREARLRDELAPDLVPRPMVALLDAMGPDVVGKICGAGGGGCMLVFGPGMDGDRLGRLADDLDLTIIPARVAWRGVVQEAN